MTTRRALLDIAQLASAMARHCPPEATAKYRAGLRRASVLLRREAKMETVKRKGRRG